MNGSDPTYKFFAMCYANKEFFLGGKVMFEVLSPLFEKDVPLDPSWGAKFSELLQFLHQTQYTFDNSELFYDMLTTIAMKIKKNPNVHWKVVLN